MSTILVDIHQACHIYSHITSHWRRISQIHHLHPLTLPVDISPHYHQSKHQSNPLTFSPLKQESSGFPSQFLPQNTSAGPLLDPTTAYNILPNAIPIADDPNMLLSPDTYLLPITSPSGPYIFPYCIPDTVFTLQNYHQCHLQYKFLKTHALIPSHPQF